MAGSFVAALSAGRRITLDGCTSALREGGRLAAGYRRGYDAGRALSVRSPKSDPLTEIRLAASTPLLTVPSALG